MQANIKSIPEKIYLVTGLYEDELSEIVDFNDLTLLWSTSKKFFHDIEYIISHPPVEQTVDARQLESAAQKANGYGVFAKNSEKYSAFNEGFIEGSKWKAQILANKVVSQLEKIIGDAFDKGVNNGCYQFIIMNNLEKRFAWMGEQPPTKDQYIKQAIEQINNLKQ